MKRTLASLLFASLLAVAMPAGAAPSVFRLTPPSTLFNEGLELPIIARFVHGQRFDLHATIHPDAGETIKSVEFRVDGKKVKGTVALSSADAAGQPANAVNAVLRGFSSDDDGIHTLTLKVTQSDGSTTTAKGNFEIVCLDGDGHGRWGKKGGKGGKARNVIVFIGDGMGIAHRTAARLMLHGATQGKTRGLLTMDTFPYTGMVMTHSLNSIVTDSSPGSSCYSTGNKGNNNQHGVFPDDTRANFDNPRVETIAQYLHRTEGRSLGLVTTSDVFDATPAAWASHTQSRGAGTGIVDQYLDESDITGLKVLLGGGRKWFLPAGTAGSARAESTDYVLPDDLVKAWGVPAGALDPKRDLISDFEDAGFTYVADATELGNVGRKTRKLLGLFSYSNMNVALDKIAGRRGDSSVVKDYGFEDQPMLDEMTEKALQVLGRDDDGFVLMVEAASIDKQAHNMDSERWILDTLEFDRAIQTAEEWAAEHGDTLIVVTADHECAGVNIIGGSRLTSATLQDRADDGGGAASLRNGVVGTYDSAGFPRYSIAKDGYPMSTDPDYKMLIGYAANGDRYEDWLTNAQPLRDSQQPFNGVAPLNTYPSGPTAQDTAGKFFVTGQISDAVAAHTASDIPVSAYGTGAEKFTGVMDNTDVFFKIMEAALGR